MIKYTLDTKNNTAVIQILSIYYSRHLLQLMVSLYFSADVGKRK